MSSTSVVNPSCWSNSEVLRWLIDVDQKQFIPAFLLNNVTGALLKQMLSGEVVQDSRTDRCTILNLLTVASTGASTVASTVASKELARHELAGLESLLREKFALPVKFALPASAAAETQPDMYNGWSYEREKDIWVRTLTISCERHRAIILQAQLKKKHAHLEVWTLVLSTLTTFLSAFATASAVGADSDPSTDFTLWTIPLQTLLTTLVLVLSFFITMFSGWSKVFSYESRLKGWDNFFAKHPEQEETPALGKLQENFVQLAPAPKDRSRSYDEFMQEFDPWTKAIEWPKLDPKDWRSTLTHIAKYYPEIWDSLFVHYYLSWAKAKDGAASIKALNDHCSQGLLARHWRTEYNNDIERTERVENGTTEPLERLRQPLLRSLPQ
mmetsp:Transcript_18850/g.44825  ORF Transcript_18850/g.44825 Transcript_18850/m.44825 type:complete len:384 (+) Transcript_18850:124-1275(+)